MNTVKRSFPSETPSSLGSKSEPELIGTELTHLHDTLQDMARLRPGEPSVYASFLGSIPPEESDEEFIAAVDALS